MSELDFGPPARLVILPFVAPFGEPFITSLLLVRVVWAVGSELSLSLRLPSPLCSLFSPALRSLHGRPGCSGSIDLPIACPFLLLSLSLLADNEAYASLHHGDASSTSPSASLRPKLNPIPHQTPATTQSDAATAVVGEEQSW